MDVGGRDSLGRSRMSCFPHPWPCLAHPVRKWGGGWGPAPSAPPLPAQTYSPQRRTGWQRPRRVQAPDLRESTAVLENPVNLKPNPTENSKMITTPVFSVRVCRASVSGPGQTCDQALGQHSAGHGCILLCGTPTPFCGKEPAGPPLLPFLPLERSSPQPPSNARTARSQGCGGKGSGPLQCSVFKLPGGPRCAPTNMLRAPEPHRTHGRPCLQAPLQYACSPAQP